MSIIIKYFKKNQDVCNVYFNLLVIRSYNTVFTVRVKLCNLHKEGGEKDTGYSSTSISLATKTY